MPIVYGSSRIRDILPNNHSAILINDFKNGAKHLADFLNTLNENDSEYEKYLEYKTKQKIDNEYLLSLLSERKWSPITQSARGNFIDGFECFVCERLHENVEREKRGEALTTHQANKTHYGCPIPQRFNENGIWLRGEGDTNHEESDNIFRFSYESANCEQKIFFDDYLNNGIYNFTANELRSKALNLYNRLKMTKSGGKRIDLRDEL